MVIWAIIIGKGWIDIRAFYLILIIGALSNLVLSIFIIPGKIIASELNVRRNKYISYFFVPALIFLLILANVLGLQTGDYESYLIIVTVFIATHIFFVVKKQIIL
jgi:hypothetical protein